MLRRILVASVFPLTEARPGGGPKFIRVNTEARKQICETTRVAPTGASNAPAISPPDGYTDARRESRYLAFG